MRLGMLGSHNREITPLSEAAAIELGAELFGEFIIFFTGAFLVTLEYLRQRRTTVKKEQSLLDRIDFVSTLIYESNFDRWRCN